MLQQMLKLVQQLVKQLQQLKQRRKLMRQFGRRLSASAGVVSVGADTAVAAAEAA